MERILLWAAIGVLTLLQLTRFFVADVSCAPTDRSDEVARLQERLEQIEGRLASRELASIGSGEPRVTLADAQVQNLEGRIRELEQRLAQFDRVEAAGKRSSAENRALAVGDMHELKALLDMGLDVNSRDEDKQTPLAIAAIAGRIEMIDLLLAKVPAWNKKLHGG